MTYGQRGQLATGVDLSQRTPVTRCCCSSSDSPPGKRQPAPARRQAAYSSGSSRSMSMNREPSHGRGSPHAGAHRAAARAPARRRRSRPSRARGSDRTTTARRTVRRRRAAPRAPPPGFARVVQRRVREALARIGSMLSSVSPWRASTTPLESIAAALTRSRSSDRRVGTQSDPHRLERQNFLGDDVAEVDVRAEATDEPHLLVLARRLEQDLLRRRRRGRSRRSAPYAPRRRGGRCRRCRSRAPRRSPSRRPQPAPTGSARPTGTAP